jgi:hypothetical protein
MLIRMFLCETCGEVRIGKHLHTALPVQNSHKQGGTFITITSNFVSEYAIRTLQETELDISALGLCA